MNTKQLETNSFNIPVIGAEYIHNNSGVTMRIESVNTSNGLTGTVKMTIISLGENSPKYFKVGGKETTHLPEFFNRFTLKK